MAGEILLIDNYDSFTHNLLHLVEKNHSGGVRVITNDDDALQEAVMASNRIIISPGPGLPSEAGKLFEVLPLILQKPQVLGVCLGHQAIAEFLGAKLYRAAEVFHGVSMPLNVHQPADALYKNLPATFRVGRYHSWLVNADRLPLDLEVTATDDRGCVMSYRVRGKGIRGIQFHPESLLSEHSDALISNWLNA
jgi:anthranilate synthase component 2